jgi:Flp pilus assembly protein CpaB
VDTIMSSKLFTTRQGTVLLGVIAAIVAGIALLAYLTSYKDSVNSTAAPVSVLVAQKLIQQGTTGDVLRTNAGYYKPTDIAKSNVEDGAIVNPATLSGQVALTDISPGQQLTASDFGPATSSVSTQLNPNQRAVVVALGSPQQVGGQIAAGSHVDVWVTSTAQASNGVTKPLAKLLFQDMYVLNSSSSNGGNVTLRATPMQAGQLIFASSNDSIWLVLRPTIGTNSKPPTIGAAQVTGH